MPPPILEDGSSNLPNAVVIDFWGMVDEPLDCGLDLVGIGTLDDDG
jgi:hypothetical protein